MRREIRLFIDDVLENIEDIERFINGLQKEDFLVNKEKQNAVVRSLEIIGEAIKNIPDSFRDNYPNIDWKNFAGLRDIISHAYFKINLNITWDIIKKDLPNLKEKILKIKKDLEKQTKTKQKSNVEFEVKE